MPAETAHLVIDFTCNVEGNHNICYKRSTDPGYTCQVEYCTVGPTTITIDITVDDETCVQVIWEGYVQAACVADPAVGRSYFSVAFTPTEPCKGQMVKCYTSKLSGITLTNPGSGYDPLLPPTVTIAPPTDCVPSEVGTQATAHAVVNIDGTLDSVILDIDGSNYTCIPIITIADPVSGVTAQAEAVMHLCSKLEVPQCNGIESMELIAALGQEFVICTDTPAFALPNGWTRNSTACCYNCFTVDFTNNEVDPITVTYIDCVDGNFKEEVINSGDTSSLCTVDQAYYITPATADVTIAVGGICPIIL